MMHFLVPSLALLAAQDPAGGDLVEIAFRPAVGLALERSFETKHDLLSEYVVNSRGDQLITLPGTMRLQGIHNLTVIDHFRAMEGSRTTDLRRSYLVTTRDSRMVLRDMEGMESPTPMKQTGPLEKGLSVVFEWSPQEEQYGKHYDAKEAEEELLIGLAEDLDLAVLLPDGPVAVGATWRVAPTALRDVFAPGGTIPYDVPRRADPRLLRNLEVGLASGLENFFEGVHDGDLSVTLREVRETEGRREAVLALVADFKLSCDQVDYLQKRLGPVERATGMLFKTATLVLEFEGTGELVWDLDGGYALSLAMDLEEHAKQYLEHDVKVEDGTELRIQDVRLGGTMTVRMTAKPVDPPAVPGPN